MVTNPISGNSASDMVMFSKTWTEIPFNDGNKSRQW